MREIDWRQLACDCEKERTKRIKYKTNEAVLDGIDKRRTMMNIIMKRKIRLIGCLLRHNQFITIIIKRKKNSKKPEEDGVNSYLKKSANE